MTAVGTAPVAAGERLGHSRDRSAPAGRELVGNSLTGSLWTLVSRGSGLVRIVVVGGVLGATYLGNTYQAINALPNLIYYQLLAGSLFVSLLVPPLIARLRDGDTAGADALVRGFLGSTLGIGLAAAVALIAASPLILRLLSLGVDDAGSAAAQRRVGFLLVLLFAPQILFYVVAGTGAAVMNACGRFALAAGAPTAENLGIIVTLLLVGGLYGSHLSLATIPTTEVVLLGVGTTAAVGVHAALQWVGARRQRIDMRPNAGWRDPEVSTVLRGMRATLAYTGLAAFQLFVTIIVANRVAGGLVAFQLALNFFYLPTAIVTWPIARALVPRLARFHQAGQMREFREEFGHAVSLASFVAIPVAVAYACASSAIANAVTFGKFDTHLGTTYVEMSLIGLSAAVIGETWFTLSSYALYSQQDLKRPLRGMALRVATTMALLPFAFVVHGAWTLLAIGLAISGGSFVGAASLYRRATGRLPQSGYSLGGALGRTALASAVMLVPAAAVWFALERFPESKEASIARLSLAGAVGAVTFVVLQVRLRAPEIGLLRPAVAALASRKVPVAE
ncbi:MAG: murein biosynthesis integral membrane protein MurJ [Gaiellaceae bacterium]